MNPITARPASDVAAPEQATPRRPVVAYLTWAVPAVVTAALGLFEIGVPQLWRDELASWSAASRTLPQLWAMLHNIDAVLGIYYFGLHLWMAVFGDSATAMRLPSVIAMAARRRGGRAHRAAAGRRRRRARQRAYLRRDPERVPLRAGGQAVRVRDVLRRARHPHVPARHGAAALVPLGHLRGGARGRGRGQPHRGVRRRGAPGHRALGLLPAHGARRRRRHGRQRQGAARRPARARRLAAAAREAVLRRP